MRFLAALPSLLFHIAIFTVVITTTGIAAPAVHAQALVPGEVLLDNFAGSNVQRYSASGTLETTYTGTGTRWQGIAITPTGNIVVGFDNPSAGIDIFNPNGTLINSFATPSLLGTPGDVSVFADGTLAISDQSGHVIRLYGQDGTFKSILTLTGALQPAGSTIGLDNTLWIADTQANKLFHMGEDGTLLNSFSLSFSPSDLVVDPTDGTLWVADVAGHNIVHLSSLTPSTFTTLGSFNIGLTGAFYGIGISGDGSTLYATTVDASVIQEFNRNGTTTGQITLVNPSPNVPHSLVVVPGAATPEPGDLTLLAVAAFPLLGKVLCRRCPEN